jgi:ribonuclease-3
MDEIDFGVFEEKTGFSFKDKALLKKAFTHRSYLNENRGEDIEHNERLEFLGDAVLELVITRFLFDKYPEKKEGELTAFRSALVNTITLSKAASERGMNDFLLLSKGEAKDTGRARQYILADTFEAYLGALYLDQGYDSVKKFIEISLFPFLDEVVEKRLWQDSKSRFQEESQEHAGVTPNYETLREIGPDHSKQFVVGVYLNDELVAEGEGKSKQEAEQMAAEKGLEAKGW